MYVAMTRFEEKIFVLGATREISLSREEKLRAAKAALNKQVESQPEKPQQSNILEAASGIIVQQVNPKGTTIGSGFNQSLGEKYPQIVDNFNANIKDKGNITGGVNFIQINDNLYIAQIPSQISTDIKSKQTDLQKLSDGLKEVAEFATQNNLQVQVPQGLGVDGVSAQERMKSWEIIQATIEASIKDAIVLPQNPEAIADIRERNKLLTEPPTPAIIELVANAERIDNQQFSSAFKELSDKEVKWLMVNAGVGSESLPSPKDEKLCTAILEDIFVDNYDKLKDETASKISVDVVQEIKQIIISKSNAESPEQEQNAVNDRMRLIEKYGELYPQLEAKAEQLIKQDKVSSKQNNQTIVEAIESALGQQPITLPSSVDADKTKPIEIMGKVSDVKVDALRSHIETNLKPLLLDDKSNYSPGRQVAWVGAEWDLKNKDFKPGIQDEKLMELVKQVYPDAAIALVTYSPNPGAGINYHRDDSYAANEARSINIGDSEWGYRAAKEGMKASRDENDAAKYQEFPLESGTVTRFNCKNEHAAINTEAGRWSINIWSIKNDLGRENSVREKYDNFVASNQPPRAIVESKNDLTIKANEWSPGGEIKVARTFDSLKDATKNKHILITTPAPQTNSTINIADIIKIGNDTQLRAANPVVPNDAKISGKPVVMAWELTNPDKNVKAVTTIDAMRTDGRVHSTRSEDYYKKYNIKEGDIALAQGKDGSKVAFRVGKQYKITQDVIDNPDYQRAWVKWEKHDIKELTGRQAEKVNEGRPLYGLFMEPLGDYNNGKIVPFSQVQQQQSSQEPPQGTTETLKINPTTGVGLGAVLSNATVLAKESNNLRNDYQVSVNGNPEAPAGVYGRENQAFKPDGVPYNSAEHAFEHQKQVTPDKDPYKIMVEVLQAKLQQHPNIVNTIEKKGGLAYLENAQITNETDKQWEGKGKESKFIQALTEAYTNVVEKSQSQSNPIASVKPLNDAVAKHMAVDVATGQVATQFIGKSSAPSTTQSTTRNYEAAWNKSANTGNYSKGDTIMVSGSGPWRGVTNQQINQTFENHYKPLLDKAIAAKASFVVGTAEGTDKLVQNYLKENGYKLEHNKQGYIEATANEKTITKESTPSKEATPSKESAPPKESTSPKESAPSIESTPPKAEIRNNVAPGVIISSRSSSPLGAALTSTTVKSRSRGSIDKDYPVSFRDNPAIAKGSYGPESYATDKPAGQPFASAEQAMLVYKETVKDLGEARVNLLAQIQQAKFEQHPDLLQAVTDNGGVEWLKQCEYKVGSKNDFWEGKGEESPFIRSLVKGYESAMGITNTNESAPTIRFVPDESISTPTPPCESIADTPTTPKSIPNVTSPTTTSEKSHNIPAFGSIDNAIGNARNAMLDTLSKWQELARKLGKSEEYLTGIAEVIDKYQTQNVGLEEGLAAMSRDMKEAERLNDVTRMAQRIANTVGRMDNVNNVLSAKTTNGYEFSIAKNDKNLLIRDKPENGGNILLYIKDGQVKENKIDDKFVTDLRKMNFAIDNALTDVKKQLVV